MKCRTISSKDCFNQIKIQNLISNLKENARKCKIEKEIDNEKIMVNYVMISEKEFDRITKRMEDMFWEKQI